MKKSDKQPNPGSDEAIKQGCCCPKLDNAMGRGAWGTEGDEAIFWVNANCPLHGNKIDSIGHGDSIN